MSIVPEWVAEGIAAERTSRKMGRMAVTESRYPHRYALDYLRAHWSLFGMPYEHAGSRAATCAWLKERLGTKEATASQRFLQEMVEHMLADAFIEEYELVWEATR